MHGRVGRVDAYLGLGANLGDRLAALHVACQRLAHADGVSVLACSRVYETEPIAPIPQPPYLNAVVRVATQLEPRRLLHLGLTIERELGRVRRPGERQVPRPIDVDLLLYGDMVIDEPGLVVPHPGLLDRAFVRVPLVDVARVGLLHPRRGVPLDVPPPGTPAALGVHLYAAAPSGYHRAPGC